MHVNILKTGGWHPDSDIYLMLSSTLLFKQFFCFLLDFQGSKATKIHFLFTSKTGAHISGKINIY